LKVPNHEYSLFLQPTTETEIINIISKMKSKTSSGWDGISMKTVKFLATVIVKPLVHIINVMLSTGIFPKKAKIAKVVPLFKKKKKNCVDNYRPVSVLPSFSKILEKVILKRMEIFAKENNLINDNQFGFRAGSSTTCSVATLTDQLYKDMDEGKCSALISLDLSKAFDSIEHKLLLHKLEWYGFRGKTRDLLQSYLDSRYQYVSTGNTKSEKLPITRGVPQGAILSPFLYNLFANDIHTLKIKSRINQFADDTSLSLSHSEPVVLITQIQDDLNIISQWFSDNYLKINVEKTQYMLITSPRHHSDHLPVLTLSNEILESVDEIKLLGITIDCRLNWKRHISNVVKRLLGLLRLFHDITRTFPKRTLILIYRSLIESHLSYAIEIWGNSYYSNIKRLFSVQKRFVRIIAKVGPLAHSAPLFSYFNIIPLPSLIVFNTLKFLFKCIKEMVHMPSIKFYRIDHVAHTRANDKRFFKENRVRTNYGKFAFSNRAAKMANTLLTDQQQLDNIGFQKFKIDTRIYLAELDAAVIQIKFFTF